MERYIGELSNPASAMTEYNIIKSVLYLWRGAWDEALDLLRKGRDEVKRSGDLQNLLNVNMNIVHSLLEMSGFGFEIDWSEAESSLEESLSLCERGLGDRTLPLCYYAFIRLQQGKLSEAEEYYSQIATRKGKWSNVWIDILLNWTKAEIEAAKKQWHESSIAFEQAYNLAKQVEQRWITGRIGIGWAEMLIKKGDPGSLERVRNLLTETHDAFSVMQATSYLERIEERRLQVHELSLAQATKQDEVVQEMAQARRVQKSFLPETPPEIAGWDLAAVLEPARETSGDYFDFIPLPGERWGIVIADVADKGAGAALFMASSRTLIRTYAAEFPDSPALVLAAANHRLVVDTPAGLFITLFYAVLDPAKGLLIYCNAGHNPPVLNNISLDQTSQSLSRTGIPLGVTENIIWEEVSISLKSGDILTLFTDGVTEAQNKIGEFFGEARVQISIEESIRSFKNNENSSKLLLNNLLDCVHQFVGSAPQSDDITLMVIHRI
jgi:serine phosphatase RsbU (regulator of sigma subunit)